MATPNPIPQNQVIFYSAGPYTLRTPAGVTIATRVGASPPSTSSLLGTSPGDIIVEEVVGAQRFG